MFYALLTMSPWGELTKDSKMNFLVKFGTIQLASILRMAVVLACIISMLLSLAKIAMITRNNPGYREEKDNVILKFGLIFLVGLATFIFTNGKQLLDEIFGFL